MKRLSTACCMALSMFISANASAVANLQGVTINELNIHRGLGNFVFIRTSTAPTVVGCQTNSDWNLVLPLDSELSNKIYSALLAAQMSQAKVNLSGTGTCNTTYGVELLNSLTVIKP